MMNGPSSSFSASSAIRYYLLLLNRSSSRGGVSKVSKCSYNTTTSIAFPCRSTSRTFSSSYHPHQQQQIRKRLITTTSFHHQSVSSSSSSSSSSSVGRLRRCGNMLADDDEGENTKDADAAEQQQIEEEESQQQQLKKRVKWEDRALLQRFVDIDEYVDEYPTLQTLADFGGDLNFFRMRSKNMMIETGKLMWDTEIKPLIDIFQSHGASKDAICHALCRGAATIHKSKEDIDTMLSFLTQTFDMKPKEVDQIVPYVLTWMKGTPEIFTENIKFFETRLEMDTAELKDMFIRSNGTFMTNTCEENEMNLTELESGDLMFTRKELKKMLLKVPRLFVGTDVFRIFEELMLQMKIPRAVLAAHPFHIEMSKRTGDTHRQFVQSRRVLAMLAKKEEAFRDMTSPDFIHPAHLVGNLKSLSEKIGFDYQEAREILYRKEPRQRTMKTKKKKKKGSNGEEEEEPLGAVKREWEVRGGQRISIDTLLSKKTQDKLLSLID